VPTVAHLLSEPKAQISAVEMKVFVAGGLLVLLCNPLAVETAAASADASLNPVTRVVELLQGLSKKVIAEGKAEEDLYEKFVCWGESVISQKTASNEAAKSRIDELEAYIEDVKAGKIEFTSERQDLEKAIAGLHADIEAADAQREKEKADFLAAKDEMQKGIQALEKAIQVLHEATSFSQTGSLLAVHAQLSQGFRQKAEESAALDRAVQLGKQFLTKGDADFLQRLLTGDVPKVDWKKLNRKAVFKMKYKARSGKIQDVLAKLLQTFTDNLAEAEAKEAKAEEVYKKLSASLHDQLDKAQAALQEMDAENSARGLTIEEAQEEVDALKEQIENDLKFIKETQQSLDDMKLSWKERQALRTGELAAISKAIQILHNDDARDLMKKSFASQGYSLLQEKSGIAASLRKNAGALIRATAVKVGDRRLLALAMRTALEEHGHFDKVIEAIDKMIATLKAEGEEDLVQKEECEKVRAEKTRAAVLESRKIDEITDAIGKLVAEIKELQAEIAEKEQAVAALKADLQKATEIREAEHLEWKGNDADDKAAADLIEQAKVVLEKFYEENNLVLVQRRVVPVEAGKAPPPPPATWEAPYAAGTQEGKGIVAILGMIKEDVLEDIEKAAAAEEKAENEYLAFAKETKAAIGELEAAIVELKATASDKASEAEEQKKTRLTVKASLDAVMKTLKDLAPDCDYFQVNFDRRSKNRAIEIDGLVKAKGILEGAAFAPPSTDATREIKPGDALLLQGRA